MSINQFYQATRYYKINGFRKESVISFIGSEPGQVVLDIGCSNGILGMEVKKRLPCKFYGTDISLEAVALARNVLNGAWHFNLEDDFANWPEALKQKYFNVVVISEVLEHLFEPEKLLLQLKRLGKADKSVIITVPNILFWKNRLKLLLGSFNYTNQGLMDRGHIHFFSWQSFKRMIAEAGYEIVGINNHIPTRGTKWLGKIWPGLFSFQFIVKIKAVIK